MKEDGVAMFPCVRDGALEITLVEIIKNIISWKMR
jgi:hypothetical protein